MVSQSLTQLKINKMYTVVKSFISMDNKNYPKGYLMDEATFYNLPPHDKRFFSLVTTEISANEANIISTVPNADAIAAADNTNP